MGSFLHATCSCCGYSRKVRFGQGMMIDKPAIIPALDPATGQFIEALQDDPRSLRYYTDRSMYLNEIDEDGIQNLDLWLSRKGNLCPGCGMMTMEFAEVGSWD